MEVHDIVLRPIITEKAMSGMSMKKYTFRVKKDANKIEIAKAVEDIFKVSVGKVNTVSVRGRLKRHGKFKGYTPDWKKAVVTLKSGSKSIEFFDGMV
jgi:large subunit ribosomal protein L23